MHNDICLLACIIYVTQSKDDGIDLNQNIFKCNDLMLMINIHKAPGMNYIFPTDFSFGSEIRFEISIRLPCRLATFLQKRKINKASLALQ